MSERLDVVGIGNAMVDAIIPSNQNEIEKHNINRDSMNLIDEDLKNNLHQEYKIKEKTRRIRLKASTSTALKINAIQRRNFRSPEKHCIIVSRSHVEDQRKSKEESGPESIT